MQLDVKMMRGAADQLGRVSSFAEAERASGSWMVARR